MLRLPEFTPKAIGRDESSIFYVSNQASDRWEAGCVMASDYTSGLSKVDSEDSGDFGSLSNKCAICRTAA
jgi:hypothetical protein